ncbi:phosphatidate phosphatase App1 family protein [Marinicella litoralis]|nr:phosphatase domain-containing protein [Marinicella litoralis]
MSPVYSFVFLLILLMGQSNHVLAGPVSEVKKDETLVFFNTSAWLNPQTDQWHIPIHGWIYETADSSIRKNLIADAMEKFYGLSTKPHSQTLFDQRVNLLLADNESNKSIVIRFANRTYSLPASASNGHFKKVLLVDAKIITAAGIKNQLNFQAVLSKRDHRSFNGQVNMLASQGLSIISDIDDTIKISAVTNRKELLNHTFYLDFEAVPGMADLYKHLLNDQGALHFVSSSPWQLYPALVDFIDKAGFPNADYALKSFRFKDSTLFNLFASSLDTKPPEIIKIIENYPSRKFILVGDSGEKDPEVYAKIQQQFPQQILRIWIRNVTGEKADDDRFQSLFNELQSDQWQLFSTADEILPLID